MKRILLTVFILLASVSLFGQLDTINIGTSANSGDGETLRSAMMKVNDAIQQQNTRELHLVTVSSAELNILDGALCSFTELNYLVGVTSAIQTQLNLKATLASPTFTGTVVLPASTSIGTVSSTEIGYLDNVTAAIQTQINTKSPTASPTFTGTVTIPTLVLGSTTITATGTALNFVDATSSVQDQLDDKLAIANGTTSGTLTTANLKIGSTGEVLSKALLDSNGYLTFFDADGDSLTVHTNAADQTPVEDVAMMIGDAPQDFKAIESIGASVSGKTLFSDGGETLSLTDGRVYYVLVDIYEAGTISNVSFVQTTAGDYTADETNYIALFTVDGDTLTQVAITANNGNLWKGTAGSYQTAAFTTPYSATAGVHAIGFIYSSSAQTTAPQIAGSSNVGYMITGLLPNHIALIEYVAAQTVLPATYVYTGTNNPGTAPYFILN
jgi:3-polyprenyl-4-hydroxybenzoate decarboxylase